MSRWPGIFLIVVNAQKAGTIPLLELLKMMEYFTSGIMRCGERPPKNSPLRIIPGEQVWFFWTMPGKGIKSFKNMGTYKFNYYWVTLTYLCVNKQGILGPARLEVNKNKHQVSHQVWRKQSIPSWCVNCCYLSLTGMDKLHVFVFVALVKVCPSWNVSLNSRNSTTVISTWLAWL